MDDEPGTPALPEGGHHITQLRMHGTAVVALVVVLGDHLSVGRDVMHVRLADNEHVEREPREAIGDRPHLLEETWTAGGQSNDVEAAPFGDGVAT